jgi:hypothetical protein
MRHAPKLALTLGLAVSVLGLATPAQAATVAPMSTHRGTSGCFNWSWVDGNVTATVYYHNICKTTQRLKVTWKSGVIKNEITFKVKAGAKGHDQEDGTIVKVAV